jgi:Transposase
MMVAPPRSTAAVSNGQEIAAAWIGKEKLRDALNLCARVTGSAPCERQVRDRLFAFYHWCAQHDDIPELITLAQTISRWEDEITCRSLRHPACVRQWRKGAERSTVVPPA